MESKEGVQKLKELIAEKDIAMMCSIHEHNLMGRPMVTSKIDDEGHIWFFTNEFSSKSSDFKRNGHVCLTYSHTGDKKYISISGKAELIFDEDKLHSFKIYLEDEWFPNGMEEPHIALLKIKPLTVRYWDHDERKMIELYQSDEHEEAVKTQEEGYHGKIEW